MTTTELQLNGWEQMDAAFIDLRIPYIKHFAKISDHHSVLDIGCGTGMLLKALPGINKVGIDMVDYKPYNQTINFVHGDFLQLTLKEKFDTVICFSVLHHVEQNQVKQFVDKAMSIATHSVCIFDIPHTFLPTSFFEQYSNNITIQNWDMPFCRFNHEHYNVNIDI